MKIKSILTAISILITLPAFLISCSDKPTTPDDNNRYRDYTTGIIQLTSDEDGIVKVESENLIDATTVQYDFILVDQNGTRLPGVKLRYSEKTNKSCILAYDNESNQTAGLIYGTPAEIAYNFGIQQPIYDSLEISADNIVSITLEIILASTTAAEVQFLRQAYQLQTFYLSKDVHPDQDFVLSCGTFEDIALLIGSHMAATDDYAGLIVSFATFGRGGEPKIGYELTTDLLNAGNGELVADIRDQLLSMASSEWDETTNELATRRVGLKVFLEYVMGTRIGKRYTMLVIEQDFPYCHIMGNLTGTVTNAATGEPVHNVQVVASGPTVKSGFTNSSGLYELRSFADGNYEVTISRSGYETLTKSISFSGESLDLDFEMTQAETSYEYRFVLSWGEIIADLDAHLWTEGYHIFWGYKGFIMMLPYAYYSADARVSGGTETIIIKRLIGKCQFAVYNYSKRPYLKASAAHVDVFRDNIRIGMYDIPTTGSGDWWYVCDLTADGGLVSKNYITSTDPMGGSISSDIIDKNEVVVSE